MEMGQRPQQGISPQEIPTATTTRIPRQTHAARIKKYVIPVVSDMTFVQATVLVVPLVRGLPAPITQFLELDAHAITARSMKRYVIVV